MVVALVLREVEFAMIGPPVPEPQSQQPSPMSEDLKDPMFDETLDATATSSIPQLPLVTVCDDNMDSACGNITLHTNHFNSYQIYLIYISNMIS